jgi:hypothetical protein
MRTLKFRAWDANKKFFPLKDFHIIGECTAFDLVNQYRIESLNDLEITQYVCKDINDEDIYEGDIIADRYDDNYVVEFSEQIGGFVARCITGKCADCSLNCITWPVVRGNIFENPELCAK